MPFLSQLLQGDAGSNRRFHLLGIASIIVYVAMLWLSRSFAYKTPVASRPLLTLTLIFAAAFLIYLCALYVALKARQPQEIETNRSRFRSIIVYGVLFRIILLFSEPIQEVDIYRYLWDGIVTTSGVDPYSYRPADIQTADIQTADIQSARSRVDDSKSLQTLVEVRDRTPTHREILERVHFPHLTTVYPPVSQLVFAAASIVTRNSAGMAVHILVMKVFIVAFDLATLAAIARLLRLCRMPCEWCIAYAWCPLVLKEFANSGHLDSIAVFLTTLATVFAGLAMTGQSSRTKAILDKGISLPTLHFAVAILLLGLATGAKIYPAILFPLLILTIARQTRWLTACLFAGVAFIMLVGTLAPMIRSQSTEVAARQTTPETSETERSVRTNGLATFASQWQMNDLLFMVFAENLKHSPPETQERRPWFVVFPDSWRRDVSRWLSDTTSVRQDRVPFLATRILFLGVFAVLCLRWAWQASGTDNLTIWLGYAFRTIAWFWLLLPTLNPWYWIWAMPYLPFTRLRTWLLMSGAVLVYYLRFWTAYHPRITTIAGQTFRGVELFDFAIVWLEFAPILVLLVLEHKVRERQTGKSEQSRHHAFAFHEQVK